MYIYIYICTKYIHRMFKQVKKLYKTFQRMSSAVNYLYYLHVVYSKITACKGLQK